MENRKLLKDMMNINKGITAFVGSGGKTSVLFQVAKELQDEQKCTIITTTTKMYRLIKDKDVECMILATTLEELEEKLKEIPKHIKIIGIGKEEIDKKLIGIPKEWVSILKKYAEYVLVEADGSRRMPIKAPGEFEPVIPDDADHVVGVIGWSGVGKCIETCSFRVDKVCQVLNKQASETIEIEDLVNLATDKEALRKDVGLREYTIVINQVDDTNATKKIEDYIRSSPINNQNQWIIAAMNQRKWVKL